ncbi:unnamed protein product, partial [Prorocentrum cordatum]
DIAAADFSRAMAIRKRARTMLFEGSCREKARGAEMLQDTALQDLVRQVQSGWSGDWTHFVNGNADVELIPGEPGRHDQPLVGREKTEFRSLIYRLNWVGRETRAEACGTASILASRVENPSVGDALLANKMVDHLRQTAAIPITLWKFRPDDIIFVTSSDAGGVAASDADKAQLAWQ